MLRFINKGGYQASKGTRYAIKEREKLEVWKFQIANRGASHCLSPFPIEQRLILFSAYFSSI